MHLKAPERAFGALQPNEQRQKSEQVQPLVWMGGCAWQGKKKTDDHREKKR